MKTWVVIDTGPGTKLTPMTGECLFHLSKPAYVLMSSDSREECQAFCDLENAKGDKMRYPTLTDYEYKPSFIELYSAPPSAAKEPSAGGGSK